MSFFDWKENKLMEIKHELDAERLDTRLTFTNLPKINLDVTSKMLGICYAMTCAAGEFLDNLDENNYLKSLIARFNEIGVSYRVMEDEGKILVSFDAGEFYIIQGKNN